MPGSNENARWLMEQANNNPQNQSRTVIEGIDEPTEEQRAARDVQIQQRGGYLHDAIKVDPYKPGFVKKMRAPLTRT